MNEEHISQTLLDQMVSSDRGQMIKAAIPYLPPKGQQIFSIYEKAAEFLNTVSVFGKTGSGSDLCAMSMPAQSPVDTINEIRNFCYGPSRDKLNQIVNMMAMIQMLQLMNQPDNNQKEEGGLNFNADEISAIIDVLKMGKSPQEIQKLDKVINLMKMMH